jgi:hypothetical protein
MNVELVKHHRLDDYINYKGELVICGHFIRDHILGYMPDKLRLWILPEANGNIEFSNYGDFLGLVWSWHGDGQKERTYYALCEDLLPGRYSVYAKDITNELKN